MDGARLDLVWLPLGAGRHCVRLNGKVYERVLATAQRRTACELFHAALLVHLDGTTTVVEVAPVWDSPEGRGDHGAVVTGPVGLRVLGRWDAFRYEVRCWPGGVVPDLEYAVGGPQPLTTDAFVCARLIDLAPTVPPLTWGRDELGLGEMWNSNSAVALLLTAVGLDAGALAPPRGGRAPGWDAGVALGQARRAPDRPQPLARTVPQWDRGRYAPPSTDGPLRRE